MDTATIDRIVARTLREVAGVVEKRYPHSVWPSAYRLRAEELDPPPPKRTNEEIAGAITKRYYGVGYDVKDTNLYVDILAELNKSV